ncbi:MAG: hypothetical protein ACLUQK_07055 [Clostridium sp.]|uniref:hypothetical protein n=1 Tax=Clostridium innocuum TaxID=1522 RepID=UPI001E51EDA9|nr:hypothetical protein [[Clostridium] innocuum]MCR0245790.1 hypothetical protein [[Clostridium] innocuum]MCR0261324.1 hypothetical protein [[Clostridium] innocuum]MCR0389827.1 hypothetical protein [[Clostridium] innocuum]MCR0505321.1 hypothetical protein [[Clostridium] innocuum]
MILWLRLLPGYSPIEAGTKSCDEQSDIYSYGRTCYVLRHGCFPEDNACGDAVDALFLRCCALDKKQRCSSMQEIVEELRQLCIA